MKIRKYSAVGAVVVAASLALAGCGSGSSGGSGSSPKVTLSLVAYSTPQAAYTKLIKAFQATDAGKNITFTQSYGASGRPEPGGGGRPEGRHRGLLARAGHDPPGEGEAGRRRLERQPVQGHRHQLGRRDRDPQGQPEEHQGLERPDQARRRGDHAQPVHLGRCALERHGGVRRDVEQGRGQAGRRRLPERAVQERPGAGRQRAQVDADLRRRQGRRLPLLRERGDHRAAQQRSRSTTSCRPRRSSSRTRSR